MPLQNLNEEHLEIINVKYKSPLVKNIDNCEMLKCCLKAIKRIHVITGWVLPDDVEYVKILTEEFSLKMKEDFYMLNFDEVYFAFRKNIKGIKDWGKAMNLDLVCSVLGAYCHERELASIEERRVKEKPTEQVIYDDEQMQNQRRADFENAYQAMRKGYRPTIYDYYEELLVLDGIMDLGDNLHEFISNKLNSKIESIYTQS